MCFGILKTMWQRNGQGRPVPLGGLLAGGAASSASGAAVFAGLGDLVSGTSYLVVSASLLGAVAGSIIGWCVMRICVSFGIFGSSPSTLPH